MDDIMIDADEALRIEVLQAIEAFDNRYDDSDGQEG